MYRKKRISIIIVLFSLIFFLLSFQLSRLTQQVTLYLTKNQVQVAEINIRYFPVPQLSLKQVQFTYKERSFLIDDLALDIDWLALVWGKIKINQVRLYHIPLLSNHTILSQLSIQPDTLYIQDLTMLKDHFKQDSDEQLPYWQGKWFIEGKTIAQDHFYVNGHFELANLPRLTDIQGEWHFDTVSYPHRNKIKFYLAQLLLKQHIPHYQLALNQLKINQTHFEQLGMDIQFNQQNTLVNVNLYQQGYIWLQLNHPQNHISNFQFSAKSISLDQWLSLFQLPIVVMGIAQLDGVWKNENGHQQARANLQITDGKINYVNLLALVAQKLPINYDDESLQNTGTPFSYLTSTLSWNGRTMQWQDLGLSAPHFELKGNGNLDQYSRQCEFLVNIQPKNKKYQQFSLPLHFFGDCHSPQYEFGSLRNLKDQLKELLKYRFSH